ncbi:MAG: 50S ribosomal protein L10 [Fidelibacterota bacterium]|jgi:large subunit ribosomal protein L10|tara:strand:+ start:555 stop:1073 length:519 start_codon:yes stop_codon:yes gene_type:complete
MPSEKNIKELERLSDVFSKAKSIYFTEYHGLKVSEITKLRSEFYKADVEYLVAKNTLLKKAALSNNIEGLDIILKGSTAIAVSYGEPVAPAKVIKAFTKESDLPGVKGILFDGHVLPGSDFKKLAEMPSKDVMLSQLISMLQSPLQKFVSTVHAPMQNVVGVLNSLKEKKLN